MPLLRFLDNLHDGENWLVTEKNLQGESAMHVQDQC